MVNEFKAVPSPCTGVCQMEGELCRGCFRSLEEIRVWGGLTDAEKKSLLTCIKQRCVGKISMRDSSLAEKSAITPLLPEKEEPECIGICVVEPWSGCCCGCGRRLTEPE